MNLTFWMVSKVVHRKVRKYCNSNLSLRNVEAIKFRIPTRLKKFGLFTFSSEYFLVSFSFVDKCFSKQELVFYEDHVKTTEPDVLHSLLSHSFH